MFLHHLGHTAGVRHLDADLRRNEETKMKRRTATIKPNSGLPLAHPVGERQEAGEGRHGRHGAHDGPGDVRRRLGGLHAQQPLLQTLRLRDPLKSNKKFSGPKTKTPPPLQGGFRDVVMDSQRCSTSSESRTSSPAERSTTGKVHICV